MGKQVIQFKETLSNISIKYNSVARMLAITNWAKGYRKKKGNDLLITILQ